MKALQNPFEFAASDAAADTAVASLPHAPAPDATATPFVSGARPSPPDDAAAPFRPTSDAAAEFECLMDDICEIFAGARKLEQIPGLFDQAAYTPADELLYITLKAMDDPWAADLIDVPEGMLGEFDPAPLFLRQA